MFAQIKAEAANPEADVWFGGTGRSASAGGRGGSDGRSTARRISPSSIPGRVRQAEQSGYRTVGVYAGALGFSFNTELLRRRAWPRPQLLGRPAAARLQGRDPDGEPVVLPAPPTPRIATVVQVMGEAKAFEYLKRAARQHQPVHQVGRGSGQGGGARRDARSASASSTTWSTETMAGFPVGSATPCEGTGYEIGSMSIVNGARNLEGARRFVDLALTAPVQALGAKNKQFQVPVQSQRRGPQGGAEALRDEADRVRLQEVRLLRRAPAPARQVERDVNALPR